MSPHLVTLLLLLAGLFGETAAGSLSEFRWSFDAESNSTSLTICSAEPIFEDQGIVISVVLIVQVSGTTNMNEYNGALVNEYCAGFNSTRFVQLPNIVAVYNLLIEAVVAGGQEVLTSTASFAMTVETATIHCSGKPLTRASAPASITFEDCLGGHSLLGNICYKEGDLTSSAVCFTIVDSSPPGVRVCLESSSPTPPVSDDDFMSINFLAYSSSSTIDATVSLDVTGVEPNAEAIFWKDGIVQSVSLFSDSPWSATSFAPDFAEYAVCAVAKDQNNQPLASSTASVTDLAMRVSHSQSRDVEDVLLQFSFINANLKSTYRVSVWPSLPNTGAPLEADLLDCANIDHNITCYRFMEYAGAANNVFVSIEYADQVDGDVENKVILPYSITPLINAPAEEELNDGM